MYEVGEGPGVEYIRAPIQTDDRRIHFGPGPESAGSDSKAVPGDGVVLHKYGERSVCVAIGFGDNAVCNFFLNHDGDVDDAASRFDEPFEKRRCDVVWKIADEMKRRIGNLTQIHFEGVRFDNIHIR